MKRGTPMSNSTARKRAEAHTAENDALRGIIASALSDPPLEPDLAIHPWGKKADRLLSDPRIRITRVIPPGSAAS